MSQKATKTGSADTSGGALVKHPVRVRAIHRGQTLTDQVFQTTPIRIGRLLDNDIVIPFDFASRYHCEIRCEDSQWTAVDLGSKNGLMIDANTRMHEIALSDGDQFRIQEVTVQLVFEVADDIVHDFHALREAATVIGDIEDYLSPPTPPPTPPARHTLPPKAQPKPQDDFDDSSSLLLSSEPKPSPIANIREDVTEDKSVSMPSDPFLDAPSNPRIQQEAYQQPQQNHQALHGKKRPLIDVDLNSLLFSNHQFAMQVRERALQMVVVWHDQVIDAHEYAIGDAIILDIHGEEIDLGTVGVERSKVDVPEGCQPMRGDAGPKSMNVTVHESAAFKAGPNLIVSFRYVPKSKDIARNLTWIEEKLVDPLVMSSAIHGTAALTTMFLGNKHPEPVRDEPERFATIIVAPTPAPVAVQPTPTPTPPPTPTPEVAKVEPPKPEKVKPAPTPKVVKTAVKPVKKRPPALARKEEKVEPKAAPKEMPQKIAKTEVKIEPPPKPEPPAPTPQPFNAKSVGTLKALSALSLGPATNVANVDKIQISRAPSTVNGSIIGRESVSGTGEMISKLSQSATGGGVGKGDPAGVAIGKNAGGKYGSKGIGGKAGTRNIRGTVIGGATYSELTKNEGLTREQVMKVVQKHQAQIQQCYEKSLMSNPDLVGRADFEWEITAKGSVTFVNVKEATIKNGENLLECVKGVFSAMKFPQAKNGENTTPTIGLPFGRL